MSVAWSGVDIEGYLHDGDVPWTSRERMVAIVARGLGKKPRKPEDLRRRIHDLQRALHETKREMERRMRTVACTCCGELLFYVSPTTGRRRRVR